MRPGGAEIDPGIYPARPKDGCGNRLAAYAGPVPGSRLPLRDVLLALVLFSLAEAEAVLNGWQAAAALSVAVCTLPIALRRRHPIVPAAGLVAAPLLARALGGMWESTPLAFFLAALIAVYSVAAYAPLVTAIAGGMLVFAGAALSQGSSDEGFEVAVTVALLAGPWLAGWFAGPHRRESQELSALAAELERQREARAQLAVAEERARLAREMHDAVAHSVSAMVVQGAAAEAVLAGSPDDARRSLRTVQTLGRASVTELRRMLKILRASDGTRRGGRPSEPADEPAAPVALVAVARRPTRPRVLRRRGVGGADGLPVAGLAPAGRAADGRGHAAARRAAPLPGRGAADQHRRGRAPWAPARPAVDARERGPPRPDRALHGRRPRRAAARARGGRGRRRDRGGGRDDRVGEGIARPLFVTAAGRGVRAVGLAVRVHRRDAEQMRTLTDRLRREGDALARLAVVDERTRVARELHDTIAHGVSVMVLQAGAAEQVMTAAPTRRAQRRARRAGHRPDGAGGAAPAARLLHTDEEDSPRAPRPSLAELDTLVSRVRDAGLPVELRSTGEPAACPRASTRPRTA